MDVHRFVPLFTIAALLVGLPAIAEEPVVGRASVIDGDTVDVHGVRVRFSGVDAPESWQRCVDKAGAEYRCGKVAADALDGFLAASRPIRCDFVDHDRNGRFVGRCRRADGADVASWIMRSGFALDWRQYSHGEYAADQAAAQAARAGMWQGDFQEPWAARKTRRSGGRTKHYSLPAAPSL
jgi:endonuclease YncB( thermonuclease family)